MGEPENVSIPAVRLEVVVKKRVAIERNMCFSCITALSVEMRFCRYNCLDSEGVRYPEPPPAGNSAFYPFYLFVDDDIAGGIRNANGCATLAEISKIVICSIVSRFLTGGFDTSLWDELVSLCGKESLRAEIESPLQGNLKSTVGDYWRTLFTYGNFSSQEFWNDLRYPNAVLLRHCEDMLMSLWEFWDWYFKTGMKGAPYEMCFDYKMPGGYPAPICFLALQYVFQHAGTHDLLYAFANKPDDKPQYGPFYGMWALFVMKSFELLVKRLGFRNACVQCDHLEWTTFLHPLALPATTLSDVKGAIDILKSHSQLIDNELDVMVILGDLEAAYSENKTPYRPFLPPLSLK